MKKVLFCRSRNQMVEATLSNQTEPHHIHHYYNYFHHSHQKSIPRVFLLTDPNPKFFMR